MKTKQFIEKIKKYCETHHTITSHGEWVSVKELYEEMDRVK